MGSQRIKDKNCAYNRITQLGLSLNEKSLRRPQKGLRTENTTVRYLALQVTRRFKQHHHKEHIHSQSPKAIKQRILSYSFNHCDARRLHVYQKRLLLLQNYYQGRSVTQYHKTTLLYRVQMPQTITFINPPMYIQRK